MHWIRIIKVQKKRALSSIGNMFTKTMYLRCRVPNTKTLRGGHSRPHTERALLCPSRTLPRQPAQQRDPFFQWARIAPVNNIIMTHSSMGIQPGLKVSEGKKIIFIFMAVYYSLLSLALSVLRLGRKKNRNEIKISIKLNPLSNAVM